MTTPALHEPDADDLLDAWARRIGWDLRRALPNRRRAAARERRAAEIAERRSRPGWAPVGPEAAQVDPPGARLRRVGEVEEPPLPRPRKRAPRTPRPPA